mgnify:FL=1
MFEPTNVGALEISVNDHTLGNLENSWQIFCTKSLTMPAPECALACANTANVEASVLEHQGEHVVQAEITLTINDYFYQYALDSNKVQEYVSANCAELNALTKHEQWQHWAYLGQKQYLMDKLNVDCFYTVSN